MTDYSDAVVAEYLRRLDVAAAPLPPDRRTELVAEIAEHIAHARASGQAPDEATLRELLDRLGEPDDIVAEARDEGSDGPPPPGYPAGYGQGPYQVPVQHFRRPSIALEVGAVVLMTVGSLIPFVG